MQRPSHRTLASDGKAFGRTAVHEGKVADIMPARSYKHRAQRGLRTLPLVALKPPRDLLFGVRSELPAGGLVASVPLAPVLVAFGVR
jgi:hypothetical protein